MEDPHERSSAMTRSCLSDVEERGPVQILVRTAMLAVVLGALAGISHVFAGGGMPWSVILGVPAVAALFDLRRARVRTLRRNSPRRRATP